MTWIWLTLLTVGVASRFKSRVLPWIEAWENHLILAQVPILHQVHSGSGNTLIRLHLLPRKRISGVGETWNSLDPAHHIALFFEGAYPSDDQIKVVVL